jgi:mannose-6-phosphate isomerase-like protein (cupin superfamily)
MPDSEYLVRPAPESVILACSEWDGTIPKEHCSVLDERYLRFRAEQGEVKFVKNDSVLGGHYHNYSEFFYLLRGAAVFRTREIFAETDTQVQMRPFDSIFIPEKRAHIVDITKGSILIGLTEKPYVSPQENDIPFKF